MCQRTVRFSFWLVIPSCFFTFANVQFWRRCMAHGQPRIIGTNDSCRGNRVESISKAWYDQCCWNFQQRLEKIEAMNFFLTVTGFSFQQPPLSLPRFRRRKPTHRPSLPRLRKRTRPPSLPRFRKRKPTRPPSLPSQRNRRNRKRTRPPRLLRHQKRKTDPSRLKFSPPAVPLLRRASHGMLLI